MGLPRCTRQNTTTTIASLPSPLLQTGLSLQGKGWKTIKSKYKGGLGEEQNLVLPFPISRAMNQASYLVPRQKPPISRAMMRIIIKET